jgi:hypothetical protein
MLVYKGKLYLLGLRGEHNVCFDLHFEQWELVSAVPRSCKYVVHQDMLYCLNSTLCLVYKDNRWVRECPSAVIGVIMGAEEQWCLTSVKVLTYEDVLPSPPPNLVPIRYHEKDSVVTVLLNDNVSIQTTRATLLSLTDHVMDTTFRIPLSIDQFNKILQLLRDGTLDCDDDTEAACRFLGLAPLDILAGTAILDETGDTYLHCDGDWQKINSHGVSSGLCAWNGKLWTVHSDSVKYMDLFQINPSWVPLAPPLPLALVFTVVVVLANNIHVLGDSADGQLHHYRLVKNSWTEYKSSPVTKFAVATIGDRLYVMGGHAVFVFDVVTEQWSSGPVLPEARYECCVCATQDSTIYLSGETLLMWDTASPGSRWVELPSPFDDRFNMLCVDGHIMATSHRKCCVFDPISSTWGTVTTKSLPVGRWVCSTPFRWSASAFAVYRFRGRNTSMHYLQQLLSLSRIII